MQSSPVCGMVKMEVIGMWLDTFNEMRKKSEMSLDEISAKSGVPKGTLAKITSGITKAPPLETMRKLVYSMGYTLNDLDSGLEKSDTLSKAEKAHIQKYRLLDPYGKEAVDSILEIEHRRCAAPAPVELPQRHRSVVTLHRPFTQVAAAEGAGAFLLDSNYDEVTVELNRFTQKADIILKVVGRSMEPEIHDGDHILVRKQPSVEEGEIGVFIIDGNGFLKQAGPDRLISLNPDIEDVIINNQQTAECYGKYICVLNPEWVVEELTAEGAK